MTDRDPLVAVLAELARLLLTDFDIEDVLLRLCEAVNELVPVDGVGVTRVDGDELRVMSSAGAGMDRLEQWQASRHEGPATDVVEDRRAVQVDVTVDGGRWPGYASEAQRLGVRRVVALPLSGRDRLWGILHLYLLEDRTLSDSHMESAQVLADAATVYILSAHDRRASELTEQRLQAQLLHDPLTGLPNRLLLADRLEHALSVSERPARSLAVLFVDLDDFKRVNDRHGHRAGDVLLAEVAGRLMAGVRASDTVARLSGDEFVVICENLHDRPVADQKHLAAVGRRMLDALRGPYDIGGARVTLRASIGAVWARSDDTADDVLHSADSAMYEAKRSGGNRVVVSDPPRTTTISSVSKTEIDLHQAQERHELRAVYQPIVPFTESGPVGAEALLRWDHPERGLLSPIDFLGAAERTGSIVPIGRWILGQACAALSESSSTVSQVSVNVSPAQLHRPEFVSDVVGILERTGVATGRLILEITETTLVTGSPAMLKALHHLAGLGIELALDDFGTGYSSFAYLKELPATILKLDQLFVAGIGPDSSRETAIIRGMTTMAHDLGLRVIAEGIETEQQRVLLVDAGCDAGQGWLFGRPEASNRP